MATYRATALLAAALLATGTALAVPTPHTENGITYLCGGVNPAEAAHMERESAHYNLMLTFTEIDSQFKGDVGIAIADAEGNPIFHTTCAAPILLVNFDKPGHYQVTAEVGGQSVSRIVHIARAKGIIVSTGRDPHTEAATAVFVQQA